MVVQVFDVVCRPFLLVSIPNTYLVLVIVCNEDIVRKLVNAGDGFSLDDRVGVRVWNLLERLIDRLDSSHLPFHHASRQLRVEVQLVQDHASNANVIKLLLVFWTRYKIKAGPNVPHDKLRAFLLVRQSTLEVVELNFPDVLCFCCNVCPHAKRNVLCRLLKGKFLLLVTLNLPVAGLFSFLLQFFFGVLSIVLYIRENVLGDRIVLLNHDVSDLLYVVMAPFDLRIIILAQSLTKYALNSLNDVLGNLAVISCFLQTFVGLLAPQSYEGSEIFLVGRVWEWITIQILVV